MLPGSSPIRWMFLGADLRVARAWQRRLGPGLERVDIARALDEAARAMRPKFLAWIEVLNDRYGHRRDWWFTRLSERNGLVSALFLHVCYLAVVREAFRAPGPPRLIVAESPRLLEALGRLAGVQGFTPHISRHWRMQTRNAIDVMLGLAGPAYVACSRLLPLFLAARWTARRHMRRRFAPGPQRVLVKTFFHAANLEADGVFRDRYLTGLHEFLGGEEREVWILPILADASPGARVQNAWMRTSSARFIIPEDWLKPSDYLGAVIDSLTSRLYPRKILPLDGLDIEPLVREERWRGGAGASCQAALLWRLPHRLRDAAFIPEQVIAWSENQLHDKALVLGCRAAFPGVPFTAVQNTPLPPNLLNLFPTRSECEHGVAADREVCSGPLAARILAAESRSKLATVVGCGLRYDYLWQSSNNGASRAAESPLTVLVLLPTSASTAVEILDVIAPLVVRRSATRWYVKAHPDSRIEEIRAAIPADVMRRLTFVEESTRECLQAADVVVTSGSGTALEAVASGIPVLLIGSATALNLDALAWLDDPRLATTCYTTEDVIGELERIALLRAADYQALRRRGIELRAAWFAPVTDDALHQFLAPTVVAQ